MKFILLSAILALATGQSTSKYGDICPGKDGQMDTISNGYNFTYTCDRNGQFSARYGSLSDVSTVEDCAAACQANTGCKGSAWHAITKKCQLYDTGEAGSLWALDTVFLRNDVPGVGVCQKTENELAQCQHNFQSSVDHNEKCNSDLQQAKDEFAQCQGNLTDATSSNQRCQTEVQKSRESLKYWTSAAAHCPGHDGRTISSQEGDGKYKMYCNQQKLFYQIRVSLWQPFEECLNTCTADSTCKGVGYFPGHQKPCSIFSAQGRGNFRRTDGFVIYADRV